MSSTSTNKQPLLVDRPLHEFVVLGPAAALTASTDYSSVLSGGCQKLVDCFDNDGAVIDSLSLLAPQASMTPVVVIFFLSNSPTVLGISATNTAPVAAAALASSAAGDRTNVSLPPLTVPVPNLGGQTNVTEASKKNTGLLVPAGRVLYVGLNTPVIAPSAASKVVVAAQGGYY